MQIMKCKHTYCLIFQDLTKNHRYSDLNEIPFGEKEINSSCFKKFIDRHPVSISSSTKDTNFTKIYHCLATREILDIIHTYTVKCKVYQKPNNTHPQIDAISGRRKSAGGDSTLARESSLSERSVEVDLESGVHAHVAKRQRDCRICHMTLDAGDEANGGVELGCCCKGELGVAHRHCAEAWFKIKGNKTCEVCGSTARNIGGIYEVELMEQQNGANEAAASTAIAPAPVSEARNFWEGHRFFHFLIACIVFASIISWLFHVPS